MASYLAPVSETDSEFLRKTDMQVSKKAFLGRGRLGCHGNWPVGPGMLRCLKHQTGCLSLEIWLG